MAQRDWGVEPTAEQLAWADAEAVAEAERARRWHNAGGAQADKRDNTGAAAKRLIASHHGAQARAEGRARRVRDEDLALGGRPRLHAGNCRSVAGDEWGWW